MEFSLSEPYFSQVKSGRKIYELRFNYDIITAEKTSPKASPKSADVFVKPSKFANFNIGDEALVSKSTDESDFFGVKVLDRNNYSSFEEALSSVPLDEILPDAKSIEDGIRLYESIPKYKEREEYLIKHGYKDCIVVFKLEAFEIDTDEDRED